MNVRLHIDRLVLDGIDVPFASRALLRAAVERELGRLIAARGLDPSLGSGGAVPSVPAPSIQPTASPAGLGTAIARAVYGGVGARGGAARMTTGAAV